MRLIHRVALSAALGFAATAGAGASRAAEPDADFYTSYSLFEGSQSVQYLVCGASQFGDGCYGGGNLGPFGRVGCMIEGTPDTVNANVVTRAIYIVDVNSGTAGNGVTLYRYLKTDTVNSQEDDRITVVLTNTVLLPLTGGAKATCNIAGTGNFLYLGTDQNALIVRIKKGPLSIQQISAPASYAIKAITANPYGYVTINYIEPGVANSDNYLVYAPSGIGLGDGGGDALLLTPYNGISNPGTYP